ncbi:cation-translocating P-type ATPase [Parasphingorhabdus sp.]|uniref:cation-translocating P-type ATPase n=1 Tax=Parasphingorhabdus sp. TaxID=2709688 RepID=UPI003D284AF2
MADDYLPGRSWRIGRLFGRRPLSVEAPDLSLTPAWTTTPKDVAANELGSNLRFGLTSQEAGMRLADDGPNIISVQRKQGIASLIIGQFKDAMIIVLMVAAVVAAIAGQPRDAAMIAAILIINAAIGVFHELRARQAIDALKQLMPNRVTVIRDGKSNQVNASELVVGDLVQIDAGGQVPADMRLTDVTDLEIDEAALTGESLSSEKSSAALSHGGLPLGDQKNMAFGGTAVGRGKARGLIIATGGRTEIGKIAALMQSGKTVLTPLQKRLARLSRKLAVAAVFVCIIIFAVGLLRGHPPLLMFMTAASVAVAAMPEALPAVVTVLLAVGARKMARHNALIRHLPAVETLGSVTYICTDKTGTLTQNKMHVVDMVTDSRDELLTAMALCSEVEGARDDENSIILQGEPTELALAEYALENGYERQQLELSQARVATFAFSSVRKRMTTVHINNGAYVAYTKGAPEIILAASAKWQEKADALANQAMRVLAFARHSSQELPASDETDGNIEIIGLVGLQDPPRPESAAAIAACKAAGIETVMITGDHPQTARAIAMQIGLADSDDQVLSGAELARLTDENFDQHVLGTKIYARVDPAQKIRIVEALQDRNQFVAMTGDGVNDAPALSRANIGVAMGKVGTDVARDASDLILLDDNFASIVWAVREGRRVYDNIRKFIRYVLACNLAEILTIFFAPLLGLPLPLLPLQILWINLVTDGLPGIALTAERAEPDVMNRSPVPPEQGIFDRDLWIHILFYGGFMAAVTLAMQYWSLIDGKDNWQTMVFTVLTFLQLGQAIAVRSEKRSIFRSNPFRNRFLIATILASAALHLVIIYTPTGQQLFRVSSLSANELAICFLVSLSGLVISEIWKLIRYRGSLGREGDILTEQLK